MSVTNPKLGAINNFIDMLQARQGQHLDKNWPGAPSLTEIISRLVIKGQLSYFEAIPKETILKVVHVASVLQRSPFRYPEGKTWLISVVRNGL